MDLDQAKGLAERKVWRTREGQEIPYEKLEDSHLQNVLAMLRRRGIRDRLRTMLALCSYQPRGDWAADGCEAAMQEFLDEDENGGPVRAWESYAGPAWLGLREEAERRGIMPTWTLGEDRSVESGFDIVRKKPSKL